MNSRLGRGARVATRFNDDPARAAGFQQVRNRHTTRVTGVAVRRLLLALSAALVLSAAFAVPLASATTGHSFAGAFGGEGLGNGFFNSGAAGIGVFGASGELFVANTGVPVGGRVQRFDASGGFVSSFAVEGPDAYAGVNPLAVDPSGSGAVYVLARVGGRAEEDVLKFSTDGTLEYLLDQAGSGTTFNVDGGDALAVDPVDGTVYVTATDGTGAPVIDRFDGSTGAFIDSINGSTSPEGGFLCNPTSLAVDASHEVYVLDPCKGPYGTGQVDEFAADGTFGGVVDDGSRGAPRAVAVDPVSDEAYVAQEPAEQPGQVFGLLTPHVTQYAAGGGAALSTFDLGSTFALNGFDAAVGMAVSGAGTVYLANSTTAQVARFAKFEGPTVVSGSSTVQSAQEVMVEGTIDPEGVASTYHFEYGNGSSYDTHTVESAAGSGNGATTASATLTGLKPNKTYHYRLVGSNASGSIDGADQTFTTAPAPASVERPEFASAIEPRSVRLHSAVNPNNSALAAPIFGIGHTIYHFEYGTTTAYGNTAVGSDGGTICSSVGVPSFCGGDYVSVAASLSGLQPGTTYHFRIVGDNGVGSPQAGADETFITPPAAGAGASSVTSTQATLTGTINPHGLPTSYHFNYGQSSDYGASTGTADAGAGNVDQRVSLPVSGLSPDTTYHVQVVATSENGVTRYGADGLFRTAPAPNASTFGPVGVSSVSANLLGELNTFGLPGTYQFEVSSTDGSYRASTAELPAAGNSGPQQVSTPIEGLPPGQKFLVRLLVTSNGSTTLGNQITFATPALPRAFSLPLTGPLTSAPNTTTTTTGDEPANSFSIVHTATKGSTATVSIAAPGPGKVEASGSRTKTARTTVAKAGAAKVAIKLTNAATRVLRKPNRRSLTVKVTLRFTPTGGKQAIKTLSLTFKSKAGR